jgi:hypothetical protein
VQRRGRRTGATVDGTPGVDTMTISSDGRPVRTVPGSLGKTTPTDLGTRS